jgi:hypothetical protein
MLETQVDPKTQLLTRYNTIRNDAWAFLSTCVYTLDQADAVTPIKKFPAHLDYLRAYTRCWEKYPKILVPKSRRMTMSWTNVALYLWDTMFHKGRLNAFVSKKFDDSAELVQRALFIYNHIPEDVIPKDLLPKADPKSGHLRFPEIDSGIQAFAEGADQLRQFTFSGIFADEMAFWENAQAMYSGAVPTLEGGGRFTGVSSPGPGFFKMLVFDQLDQASGMQAVV